MEVVCSLAWGLGAREELPQTEGIEEEMTVRRPPGSLRRGLGI